MREYSSKIALLKNSRGIYSLDTSIGCRSGMKNNEGGCYGDCYAAKSAKLYGYDFSKTVLRHFESEAHRKRTLSQINKSALDFIRIGTSGDPSENWDHAVGIIKQIDKCNKNIVIITKHWTNLSDDQLEYFAKINICINTSVSALDNEDLLINSLFQFERIKPYCKSILRIVSCDFNLDNSEGLRLSKIQHDLFKKSDTIDTVLRLSKGNDLIKSQIIKTIKTKFLGKNAIISKLNKSTYFGKCSNCHEMCGVKMSVKEKYYPEKLGISKQATLFKIKQK